MAKILSLPTGKFKVVPSRDPANGRTPKERAKPPFYGPALGYDSLAEAKEKMRQLHYNGYMELIWLPKESS